MQKLVPLCYLVVMMVSYAPIPTAHAANVAQSLCEYVAADDKKRMRSFLKTNKLKIRSVFQGIQCNGMNLLEFAADNGSVKTGAMMISKLPKKIVKANLGVFAAGSELEAAANKRVGK